VLDFPLTLAPKAERVDVQDAVQVELDPSSNASALIIRGKELDALSDDRDDLAVDLAALAGPAAGPNGGQVYLHGFTGGRFPGRRRFAKFASTRIPFPRNTIASAWDGLRSLPSLEARTFTARFKLTMAILFSMPGIRSRR